LIGKGKKSQKCPPKSDLSGKSNVPKVSFRGKKNPRGTFLNKKKANMCWTYLRGGGGGGKDWE